MFLCAPAPPSPARSGIRKARPRVDVEHAAQGAQPPGRSDLRGLGSGVSLFSADTTRTVLAAEGRRGYISLFVLRHDREWASRLKEREREHGEERALFSDVWRR